jgi:hypothetical protein
MLRSTLLLLLALASGVAATPAQSSSTPAATSAPVESAGGAAAPHPSPAATPGVTVSARALQPGEIVVLAIATGEPAAAVRARAFDLDWRPFRTGPSSWRAVIGIDLDVRPGTHSVSIEIDRPSGSQRLEHSIAVVPKQFRTRRLTVDSAYVDPPAAVQARIAEEARLLAAIWTDSAANRLWTGGFVRPVPQEANSAFGTRSIFNGQARSPHGGADFLSPAGTPVKAPNHGRVVLARDLYYTGGTVAVDHGLGLVSLFAHLSRIDVAEGDLVTPGQVLGQVGATGRVTGPHLHWTLRLGGARVDPLSLLAVLGN